MLYQCVSSAIIRESLCVVPCWDSQWSRLIVDDVPYHNLTVLVKVHHHAPNVFVQTSRSVLHTVPQLQSYP
jgi:hypothetical protein